MFKVLVQNGVRIPDFMVQRMRRRELRHPRDLLAAYQEARLINEMHGGSVAVVVGPDGKQSITEIWDIE